MSSAAFLHPAPFPRYPALPSSQDTLPGGHRRRVPDPVERWASSFRDGLPTPPQSTMSTSISGGYASAHSNVSMAAHQIPMYQPSNLPKAVYSASNDTKTHYRSTSGDAKGLSAKSAGQDSSYESKRNSNASIASYLQIPSSINSSQGSLSEFATEITCLFWFESGTTLRQIEEASPNNWSTITLTQDTSPTIGFRKWVTTILSTTQVTQNVILLALLFVYRLKKFNPSVSGKKGSEYRLFTIALMLGNKFLDDNTYTNKTWAEVSGIAVQEIHIMEVEFLSNMRYNLFVSEKEWQGWQKKLSRFYNFLSAASRTAAAQISMPLTPTHAGSPHKLPSPPSPVHVTNYNGYGSIPQQRIHPLSQPPTLPPSPTRSYPDQNTGQARKRSWDATLDERPAKRPMSGLDASSADSPYSYQTVQAMNQNGSQGIRLPVPRLQTSLPRNTNEGHPIQLPLPTGRAMATVYPAQQSTWSQSSTPTNTTGPVINLYSTPIPQLPDVQSQQFVATPTRTSPTGSAYQTVTPTTRLSPSYFLTNRNSPYRPVRHVHTLLNPPPSTSLHDPSRNINFDQIRYQPLSKNPTQPRPGLVPYLPHDSWSNQVAIPPMNPGYGYGSQ